MARRRFRKVAKDKKTGVPKKYLSGAKNKAAKAAEIKRTSEAYKRGETLDIKAIQKSRVNQDGTKKKTTSAAVENLREKAKKRALHMDSLLVFIDAAKVHIFQAVQEMFRWRQAMGRVNSFISEKYGAEMDADIQK